MTILPRTDVHQHLWPTELLAALSCAATVGAGQLVHGSDVPVVRGAAPQDDEALLRANPARLLG